MRPLKKRFFIVALAVLFVCTIKKYKRSEFKKSASSLFVARSNIFALDVTAARSKSFCREDIVSAGSSKTNLRDFNIGISSSIAGRMSEMEIFDEAQQYQQPKQTKRTPGPFMLALGEHLERAINEAKPMN